MQKDGSSTDYGNYLDAKVCAIANLISSTCMLCSHSIAINDPTLLATKVQPTKHMHGLSLRLMGNEHSKVTEV